MIDHGQLREYIIQPVLRHLDAYSPAAEELLILTAAAESLGGRYLHQLGDGPAVGIYQMEPATHDDIWRNWLAYREHTVGRVRHFEIPGLYDDDNAREMAGNLYYATAMCRCHYRRDPHPLPSQNDLSGLAAYYKRVWNTSAGSATVEMAMTYYQDLVR